MKLKIFIQKDGSYLLKILKNNEWYILASDNSLKSIWRAAKVVKLKCNIDVINLVKL